MAKQSFLFFFKHKITKQMKTNSKKKAPKKQVDLFQDVTDRILKKLEEGFIPWQKPWSSKYGILPQNLLHKKIYKGINLFLLCDFEIPMFLTFNQIKGIEGAKLKKGSKGQRVICWNRKYFVQISEIEKIDVFYKNQDYKDRFGNIYKAAEVESRSYLGGHVVFNVEQIEGVEHLLPEIKEVQNKNETFENTEALIQQSLALNNLPKIEFGGNQAFYNKGKDYINIPYLERFISSEEYYSTIFHEGVHSTGHPNRLNRKELTSFSRFGDKNYSKEELTAELGAAYLCALLGIDNQALFNNSAAYLQGWINALKGDSRLLINAASQSTLAVDYLIKGTTLES